MTFTISHLTPKHISSAKCLLLKIMSTSIFLIFFKIPRNKIIHHKKEEKNTYLKILEVDLSSLQNYSYYLLYNDPQNFHDLFFGLLNKMVGLSIG